MLMPIVILSLCVLWAVAADRYLGIGIVPAILLGVSLALMGLGFWDHGAPKSAPARKAEVAEAATDYYARRMGTDELGRDAICHNGTAFDVTVSGQSIRSTPRWHDGHPLKCTLR